MFGAILRAAPQALFIALLASVSARITEPLIDFTLDNSPAAKSDMLVSGLQSATDNYLLVGIAALLLALVARAVVEARVGGV